MVHFKLLLLNQRLHATHNLMELLNAKHPGIPPTLRDDRLSEEVIQKHLPLPFHFKITHKSVCLVFLQKKQLQQHYMTKYDSEVADAHQNLQPVLQNIKELKCKVRTASSFSSGFLFYIGRYDTPGYLLLSSSPLKSRYTV